MKCVTDMVVLIGQMDLPTKDIGKMTKLMEVVNLLIQMEQLTMEIG